MEACRTQSAVDACKVRPEFWNLELADQAAMIRNCVEVTADVMWKCAAKNERLVEWIGAGSR